MTKIVLALAFTLLSTAAFTAEPVQSPDALEREISACLLKSAKTANCMETVLGRSILPGNDQLVSVATQMDELMRKWLDKDTVFAIHPIREKKFGDICERRLYLIEDTSGALMIFEVALLKRLGKWYVYQMNVNSTSDKISALLNGD